MSNVAGDLVRNGSIAGASPQSETMKLKGIGSITDKDKVANEMTMNPSNNR